MWWLSFCLLGDNNAPMQTWAIDNKVITNTKLVIC